jgi:hypothetical protein
MHLAAMKALQLLISGILPSGAKASAICLSATAVIRLHVQRLRLVMITPR